MIRHADYGDIPQLKEIWSEAFGEEDYGDDFYERIFRPGDILCETDGSVVVAMLNKIPCMIDKGQGVFERAYYLFALATRSKWRGQGIMGRLIACACEEIRGQGVKTIFLIPAEESLKAYYQRFDLISLKYMPVFELHCTKPSHNREQEAQSKVTAQAVFGVEAAAYLKGGNWKYGNRNVYFTSLVESFCLEWALKEEQAVFYKIQCQGRESGFLLGKRDGGSLQVSVYGMASPCWLQLGEALADIGITKVRIPAWENPCEMYFRRLNENGGFPISVRSSERIDKLHGMIPI